MKSALLDLELNSCNTNSIKYMKAEILFKFSVLIILCSNVRKLVLWDKTMFACVYVCCVHAHLNACSHVWRRDSLHRWLVEYVCLSANRGTKLAVSLISIIKSRSLADPGAHQIL